jgi:hypothetical protein
MSQKRSPTESRDKGADKDETKPPTPMENFKQLAGGLLKVSREQLHKEQKRYRESRGSDKAVKKMPGSSGSSSRNKK